MRKSFITQAKESDVSIVDKIISEGFRLGAKTIHIKNELFEVDACMTFSRKNKSQCLIEIPITFVPAVIARLKYLADLLTDENEAFQTGTFDFAIGKSKPKKIMIACGENKNGIEEVLLVL